MRALPATTADDVVACQRADNWARFSCTDKNSHREASSHGLLLCETAKKRCSQVGRCGGRRSFVSSHDNPG